MGKRRNKYIKIGDSVKVAQDIERLPNPSSKREAEKWERLEAEWYTHQRRVDNIEAIKRRLVSLQAELAEETALHKPMTKPQHLLFAKYAEANELGEVVADVSIYPIPRNLQVQMETGELKTFRSTSLVRVDN